MKVFTFSTNISAGHRRAAEAVARAILAAAPHSRIIERDSMALIGRNRKRLLTSTYLGIIQRIPDFWNHLYHNKRISPGINGVARLFFSRAYRAFESEIRTHRPDVVICTQAIPARIIADLKIAGRCDAPLLAVATDYGIHPYWAHPGVDLFAVPCEAAVEELISDGISSDRIHVTGIPVDSIFEHPPTMLQARTALGLPEHGRVVLCMGGGNGLGLRAEDVLAVEGSSEVDHVIVIAGCNATLAEEIAGAPATRGVGRTVLPTVTNIERYYAAADLVVSKPGGLTMSECTAMGKPIIMIAPLPGQEVRNANFLTRAGAAVRVSDAAELNQMLDEILASKTRLSALADSSACVGRSGASRRIAELALNLAQRTPSVLAKSLTA